MLKVIGCLLIGAASVGLAISFGVELREHLTLLYDLRRRILSRMPEKHFSEKTQRKMLRICLSI